MKNLNDSISDIESKLTGATIPNVNFEIVNEQLQWTTLNSTDIFTGKKVILFALPGAFTPTCSSSHLPRYDELASTFKNEGIDDIVCLSVNDTFVMNAWKNQQGCKHITFLPDGNADFSKKIEMLVDKEDLGFGQRSWRYSLLINDSIIEKVFIEEDTDGDPFKVSDADTMLNYINPDARTPLNIALIEKRGCSHCAQAKEILSNHNLDYQSVILGENNLSRAFLSGVSGHLTTPQIFIDGVLIGGADELEKHFA